MSFYRVNIWLDWSTGVKVKRSNLCFLFLGFSKRNRKGSTTFWGVAKSSPQRWWQWKSESHGDILSVKVWIIIWITIITEKDKYIAAKHIVAFYEGVRLNPEEGDWCLLYISDFCPLFVCFWCIYCLCYNKLSLFCNINVLLLLLKILLLKIASLYARLRSLLAGSPNATLQANASMVIYAECRWGIWIMKYCWFPYNF